MIQSRPKLKNNKIKYISLICAAISVILMYTAQLAGKYASILQTLSLCAISYGLYLITRHLVYDYLYTLDNGAFLIHKVTKSKSICVTDVDIKDLSYPMSKEEYERKKDNFDKPVKTFYFYKNYASDDLKYILWSEGDSTLLIIFEPDKDFAETMRSEIEKYKNETSEEKND